MCLSLFCSALHLPIRPRKPYRQSGFKEGFGEDRDERAPAEREVDGRAAMGLAGPWTHHATGIEGRYELGEGPGAPSG